MVSKNKKRKQNRHQETNTLRQEKRRAEKEANRAPWVKIVCQDLPDEMRENVQDLLTKTGEWIEKNKLISSGSMTLRDGKGMANRDGFISQHCHPNVSAVLAYVKSEMKNPFPHQINLVTGYVGENKKYMKEIGEGHLKCFGLIYHSWLEIDGHRVDPTPDTFHGTVRDFPRHYPEPKDQVINLPLDEVSRHQDLSAGWSDSRDVLALSWRDKTIQEWKEIRLYPNHPDRKELLDRFWDESLHLQFEHRTKPSDATRLLLHWMTKTNTFLPTSDHSDYQNLVGEVIVYPKSSGSLLPPMFRDYLKDPSELSEENRKMLIDSDFYRLLEDPGVLPVVEGGWHRSWDPESKSEELSVALRWQLVAPIKPLCLETFKPLPKPETNTFNTKTSNLFQGVMDRLAA